MYLIDWLVSLTWKQYVKIRPQLVKTKQKLDFYVPKLTQKLMAFQSGQLDKILYPNIFLLKVIFYQ